MHASKPWTPQDAPQLGHHYYTIVTLVKKVCMLQIKSSNKTTKRSPRVVFGSPGDHKRALQPPPVQRFEMMRPREVCVCVCVCPVNQCHPPGGCVLPIAVVVFLVHDACATARHICLYTEQGYSHAVTVNVCARVPGHQPPVSAYTALQMSTLPTALCVST